MCCHCRAHFSKLDSNIWLRTFFLSIFVLHRIWGVLRLMKESELEVGSQRQHFWVMTNHALALSLFCIPILSPSLPPFSTSLHPSPFPCLPPSLYPSLSIFLSLLSILSQSTECQVGMEARNFHEAFRMLTSEWKAKSKVIAFDALPGCHGGETSPYWSWLTPNLLFQGTTQDSV